MKRVREYAVYALVLWFLVLMAEWARPGMIEAKQGIGLIENRVEELQKIFHLTYLPEATDSQVVEAGQLALHLMQEGFTVIFQGAVLTLEAAREMAEF
jgi:hypothetical protein